jgi:hypothetical protein
MPCSRKGFDLFRDSFRGHPTKNRPRQGELAGAVCKKIPAMTYSRPRRTTIGPGCLTAVFGMGTGVAIRAWSPGVFCVYQQVVGRRVDDLRTNLCSPVLLGGRVNAAKRSAVSTGRLRPLLALHVRPIDQVVFLEPSHLRAGDLVSRGASRLDAFSVYPSRTLATQRCR